MSDHTSDQPDLQQARTPLGEMLFVAAPVVATMASYTIAQFIDGLMVTRLGEGALSAQGNGAVIAFVPIAIMMGLFGVINTYVSQSLGAGAPRRGTAYPWNGVWMGVVSWALVMVPMAIFLRPLSVDMPRILAEWVGHIGIDVTVSAPNPEVIENQLAYARILLLGAIFTLSARAMSHFFFGMHAPMVVLVATVIGSLVNVGMNWLLIFGNLGFPELGVPGAAIGTVIGSAVEWIIPFVIFLGPKLNAKYGTRSTWRPSLKRMREILKIGWPAGVMFGNELICWAIMMAGLIGTISVADNEAAWIGLRYMHLSFMPAVGMSVAVTAIVGRCIGSGRPDLAVKRAWLGMGVTMAYMGACAACFMLFREQLVGIFISDRHTPEVVAEIIRIGSLVMICAALFQVFDAIGITMMGALRGAGDTVVPGVFAAVASWVLIILGGWMMKRLFPELGSLGPWIAASVYIIVFAVFMLVRFQRGGWRSIRLLDDEESRPDTESGDMAVPALSLSGAPPMADFEEQARDRAGERCREPS